MLRLSSVSPWCRTAKTWGRAIALVFPLLLASTWVFGQSPSPAKGAIVWPPAPEQPRIAYVQSISKPSEAGVKSSGFRRLANWVSGANQGNEPLNRPFGLAVDESGNLCLTDTGANAVCFFDSAAGRWYRWEQVGNVHFTAPVAVAKKGKTLFVADSGLPAVIAFDTDGKLLFQITQELARPTGVVVSGDHLIVADSANHSVAIFDLHGKLLSRFGSRGEHPGEFNYPTHVAADAQGNIYVTDSINCRVQVFDSKGTFLRQIAGPGDVPGSLSRPKGVAVDGNGHTYVVDAVFENVQIFDADSHLLLDFGKEGNGPGEFSLPNGVAVGRDNRIYVADSYNGRVQVFQALGEK